MNLEYYEKFLTRVITTMCFNCWHLQMQKREECSDKKKKPSKSKVNPTTKKHYQEIQHVPWLLPKCVCVCPDDLETGLWGPWFVYVGMNIFLMESCTCWWLYGQMVKGVTMLKHLIFHSCGWRGKPASDIDISEASHINGHLSLSSVNSSSALLPFF